MKVRSYSCTLALVAGATVALWAPHAHGQWGSIRGNNRSVEHHAAPAARSAPAAPRGTISRAPAETPRAFEHGGGEHRGFAGPIGGEHRGFEHSEAPHRDFDREMREHRHLDIDADRRHGFFWFGWHPGMVINTLPPDYTPLYVGPTPYYYDQGVYYESSPSGYVVVTPPIGAIVPQLPPGAEAIPVGPTVYYYAAGAFYVQQPQGFMVVAPPLGVTVSMQPPGATAVNINGTNFYHAGGAYFLPVMQDGVTVYETVRP